MQLSRTVVALVALHLSSATTSPVGGEEAAAGLETRQFGFGCPLDQERCHNHCRSIGRRGGYCGNFLKRTCICYRN